MDERSREHSKVLAMHDARAQVLGGKLGAVAGAVAGLDAGQAAAYEAQGYRLRAPGHGAHGAGHAERIPHLHGRS